VVPEVLVQEDTQYVPGTDGGKMSKSQNNTIDVLADPSSIKKVINKQIVTDATPLEDPKDPESAVVFQLYKLVASEEKVEEMACSLKAGGYGWGHAKKALLETLTDEFEVERERFKYLMANRGEIDAALEDGARKARLVAADVMKRVRPKLGY
jgi:tryptophanyl-tRNA synthetase